MSKTIHLCLDIEGALNKARHDPNLAASMFAGISDSKEVIKILEQNLRIGRKVLPFGECEGFDYRTGCPGHEKPEVQG